MREDVWVWACAQHNIEDARFWEEIAVVDAEAPNMGRVPREACPVGRFWESDEQLGRVVRRTIRNLRMEREKKGKLTYDMSLSLRGTRRPDSRRRSSTSRQR